MRSPKVTAFVAALGLCLLLGSTSAWAAFDLQALAALLAERKSGEATFTEERFVSGFDSPLRSSGKLSFKAPDSFSRETLEPLRESMQVQGKLITLQRSGRTRRLELDGVPELQALVEAMRATLTGNFATLQQHFDVQLQGQSKLWTLTLLPRDERLASQVREMQIAGQDSDIRSVALWLRGGDRSLMLVQPLSVRP